MGIKLVSIAICTAVYLFSRRRLGKTFAQLGRTKQVAPARIRYLSQAGDIALFFVFLMVVCLILGLGFSDVSLFVSSVFAIIGIALFAQWSILSNITASMVIFFSFPYRIGDMIKVTDADFDLSGEVEEISLFHVMIRTKQGNVITYPNSLILQKPVIKLDGGNTRFPGKINESTKPALNLPKRRD